MKKYLFSRQISKKFRSIEDLPEWINLYPQLQDQIKTHRETLGMTQDQLGKRVNRSWRSIQQIESGHAMPKLSILAEIATALNTELKILLVPKEEIENFLERKAAQKAEEFIRLNKTSSSLEIQTPSEEEVKEQTEKLKREILEKKREILWNTIQKDK